jgi:CHAT domain-containing protein
MSMRRSIFAQTSLALATVLAMSGAVSAASAATVIGKDQFALGRSTKSGAVCQATRNYDDPAAQGRGAREWDVSCRGWEGRLGRLYLYSWQGERQVAAGGPWAKALATQVACAAPANIDLSGLSHVTRAACKPKNARYSYVAYTAGRSGHAVAADGLPQIADVLETGLRVVSGAVREPKATQDLPAASSGGGDATGLADAVESSSSSPDRLRERGYERNQAWQFSEAEGYFRQLAQDTSQPAAVRAENYLNWALNTSNQGRFDKADEEFAEADKLIGGDKSLQGLVLNYRALHLRNERKFDESLAAAERAEAILTAEVGDVPSGGAANATIERGPGGAVQIDSAAAQALSGISSFSSSVVGPQQKSLVRLAQSQQIQATALAALNRNGEAEQKLTASRDILARPDLANIDTPVRVEVAADLARQEQAQGQPARAVAILTDALAELRSRQAASPHEAFLNMELGRAQALAGSRTLALQTFAQAIGLFRETRGSLGASADAAAFYLDMLLAESQANPAQAHEMASRFLDAAESLSSQGTADTIARLSARLTQGDTAAAGLIRALEDTRRQIRAAEGEIALLQAQNAYAPAVKVTHEAALKSLREQATDLQARVGEVDARYGTVVTSDISLSDLQGRLKPGEVFVKVVLLSAGGYGLAVTSDSATPYTIALSEDQGRSAVETLRRPFEVEGRLPAYDVGASYALFQKLFGPVRAEVLGATHVIYEPDNALMSLPIAALATDQASVDLIAKRRDDLRKKGGGVLSYNGVAWLGRKAETSLVLTASTFVLQRDQKPSAAAKSFIGFGAPVQPAQSDARAYASVIKYGNDGGADADVCQQTRKALFELQPLSEARQELQKVNASIDGDGVIVTGASFNDGAVESRSDLKDYRVVYFATHGLLPEAGGCLPSPALLTSVGDKDSDGLLDMLKVLDLKLDADLVVLSACDTGGHGLANANDATGLGDAGGSLAGLTRAFIHAGARSLVVSHWRVDSDATVKLLSTMFSAKKVSEGDGLRDAMRKFMDEPDQYSHPYYWAAFTIVGDAAREMPN